ncbi:MAG: hypothetical protein HYS62_00665 [Candidatus Aenigmarchaeota archaeon]|nr:hypothetical protein [Candidatus Aenigmarchaeota archaeon]
MVFFDVATINLAVAIFVVVALAEYSKYRQSRPHAFRLLASAGLLFLVAGVFTLPDVYGLSVNSLVGNVAQLLGEVVAVIALVYLVLDSLRDWKKDLKV